MPQIFVMLSLYAQQQLADAKELSLFLDEVCETTTECVVQNWKVPKEDVAASAMGLLYSSMEADVQIEIRYTAGEDEYDRGEAFDPCPNDQMLLNKAVLEELAKREHGLGLTFSVWCKPYRRSKFTMGPKRGAST
jgi:hypothetical protein